MGVAQRLKKPVPAAILWLLYVQPDKISRRSRYVEMFQRWSKPSFPDRDEINARATRGIIGIRLVHTYRRNSHCVPARFGDAGAPAWMPEENNNVSMVDLWTKPVVRWHGGRKN